MGENVDAVMKKFTPMDWVYFCLGSVYCILFLISIILYFRIIRFNSFRILSTFFTIAFVFGLLARATFFILQPLITHLFYMPKEVNFILNTIPAFFFFTTFMLLLLLWGDIYMNSYDRGTFKITYSEGSYTRTAHRVVLMVNVILYISLAVIYSLDVWWIRERKEEGGSHRHSRKVDSIFEEIIVLGMSAAYLICTVSFFFYGYVIYRKRFYQRVEVSRSYDQKRLLRLVGILGIICCLTFLARSFLTGIQLKITIPSTPVVIATYYTILEIFPLVLMLTVVVATSKRSKSQYSLLTASSPLITDVH